MEAQVVEGIPEQPPGAASGESPDAACTPVYRLSDYIHEYPLESGGIAIWNSFWPQPTVVSPAALEALRALPSDAEKWPAGMLADLHGARILYTGDADPSEREFFETADRWIEKIDQEADELEAEGGVYRNLALVNSGCNLGCSYCVSYFGDDGREHAKRDALRGAEREDAVLRVVEQYLTKVRDAGGFLSDGVHHCRLTFNGGEILLRWKTVKKVIDLADAKFPELCINYHMNSNATLLTPQIAEVLAAHRFRVAVSIDGYGELHDESRVYHGGGGSFEHVMRGIDNYREASDDPATLKGFQGTIENIDDFDFEKFFEMQEYGFDLARLAPNVLDHSDDPRRGRQAAFWEARLVVASQGRRVGVGATEFESRIKRAGEGKPFGYRPNCGGLDGTATKTLTLNIDSMQAGQLCSFTSPASMPIGESDNEMDHRALYAATRKYLTDRLDVVKNTCNGCSVVGICQGGCVYTALDVYNRKNPAGCAYQRALWRHALDFNETATVREITDSREDAMSVRVRAEQDAASGSQAGCGSHESPGASPGAPAPTPVALLTNEGRTLVPKVSVAPV